MQDKTEWKLNGQVLVFTLPLSDQARSSLTRPLPLVFLWHCCAFGTAVDLHGSSYKTWGVPPAAGSCLGEKSLSKLFASSQVSVIKVKIHEATGMPAGKQKLQYEVGISPTNTVSVLSCIKTDFLQEKPARHPLRYWGERSGEWCLSCLYSTLGDRPAQLEQARPSVGDICGSSRCCCGR